MWCRALTLLFFFLSSIPPVSAQGAEADTDNSAKAEPRFAWPEGAEAAVCLTYDDGRDCHLDSAAPDLESHGFRGTFYCHGLSGCLHSRMDEWRALATRGHELGNHTLFHPCNCVEGNGEERTWVHPEYALENYTTRRIRDELWVANSYLKAVDGKDRRTFAYTCAESVVGGKSYIDEARKLFPGARGIGPVPTAMSDFDCFDAPSFMVDDHPAADLIAQVEEAAKNGTVATFMFHNVGGGYLNVSSEAHRELLGYLEENKSRFYVAPMIDIVDWVSKAP